MTNIKVKGEEAFIKDFEEFIKTVNQFKTKFQKFKEGVEEKRDWVNERSPKWFDTAENETFNIHLYNVEDFVNKVYDSLEIMVSEYPLNNE